MKVITAHIPARSTKLSNGTTKTYQARIDTYTQDDSGKWSGQFGPMLESDVIDVCKRASNWTAIRAEHFPMYGFHS